MPTEVKIPIYNITAPGVVVTPATRSRFISYSIFGGSTGTITFNDCATLAEASVANQIFNATYTESAGVTGFLVDWPITQSLVCSSIPSGATVAVIYTQFIP